MTPEQLRNLVKEACKRDISTVQAKAFMEIFQNEYDLGLAEFNRSFVEYHFGNYKK
jgi:hypothetical protein